LKKLVAPVPESEVFTVKVSTLVEVALTIVARKSEAVSKPLTRKEESKVELARTKIPAVLEVGVKALVNSNSQAPAEMGAEVK